MLHFYYVLWNENKYMEKTSNMGTIMTIVIIVLVIIGVMLFMNKSDTTDDNAMMTNDTMMTKNDTMVNTEEEGVMVGGVLSRLTISVAEVEFPALS